MHALPHQNFLTPLLQPSPPSPASTMGFSSEKIDPEVSQKDVGDTSSTSPSPQERHVPTSTYARYFCRPIWISPRVKCPRRWWNGHVFPGSAFSFFSLGALTVLVTLALCVAIVLSCIFTLMKENSSDSTPALRLAVLANFPDPSIYQAQGIWYMYGTNAGAGILNAPTGPLGHLLPQIDRPHVQLATSSDFTAWSIHNNATQPLPRLGVWAKQSNPNTTCPNVIQRPSDGKYIMYYSAIDATSAYHIHCTGTGISDSPVGPFTPGDSALICPATTGGGIDPSAFIEPSNNTIYVVYKINAHQVPGVCLPAAPGEPKSLCNTPIYIQPIDSSGLAKVGDPHIILNRTKADGPLIEAPSLVKVGSLYYLFFSSGATTQPDYTVKYATSTSLYGPYTRAANPLLRTGDYHLNAPGSCAVTRTTSAQNAGAAPNLVAGPADDKWRIALAARVNTSYGGVRAVFTAGLVFDEQARTVGLVADQASSDWKGSLSASNFQGKASYSTA